MQEFLLGVDMKSVDVFEKILDEAKINVDSGCPDYIKANVARKNNIDIPDECLPGRLVMNLSDEERKALANLKASDINFRPDAI